MMEQIPVKPVRKRRSILQIQTLLKSFDTGDKTVQQFCKTHSISKGTFYKWQNLYGTIVANNNCSERFAPIQIISSASQSTLFAEVNGIKIYQSVGAVYLKELCAL